MRKQIFILAAFLIATAANQQAFAQDFCSTSLTADFSNRDQLPETDVPRDQWASFWGGWGPRPLTYPGIQPPQECAAPVWLHQRTVSVAEKFIGLPYRHNHIPEMGGLDCSNFTAWVFNYGFGLRLDSEIHRQSETAGRKLLPTEKLEVGDLLFIWNRDKTQIAHVVIYINENSIIDSTGVGVQVRPLAGWYKDRYAWARRIFD
jgi:hypothetical protein